MAGAVKFITHGQSLNFTNPSKRFFRNYFCSILRQFLFRNYFYFTCLIIRDLQQRITPFLLKYRQINFKVRLRFLLRYKQPFL